MGDAEIVTSRDRFLNGLNYGGLEGANNSVSNLPVSTD